MNAQRKPPATKNKKVWRITPGAPQGEWVDVTPAATSPKADARETSSGNWAMSSFDLAYGADITEISDTLPNELLDELFPPAETAPKKPEK